MAFGKMIGGQQQANGSSGNGKNPFIDVREGKRVVRFLPDPAQPNEPLLGQTVLSVWMTVKKGEADVMRRIFVDYSARSVLPKQYNEAIRRRFFMNVLDKSMVVKLDDGSMIYGNNQNQFMVSQSGELVPVTDRKPARNMQIMVLEGSVSSGQGRNGLLNEIEELSKSVFDEDTNELVPITKVDIELVTRGKGLNTNRAVYVGANRDPIPAEILKLPLYDIDMFAKAFPTDAIKDLLKGMDYSEVLKAYEISAMPRLIERSEQTVAQVVAKQMNATPERTPAVPAADTLFDD
jgi:hypothetical protein